MMVRALLLAAVLALATSVVSAAPIAPVPNDCWGKLKPSLEQGGFSRGTDCDFYDFDLNYVGETNGVTKYKVYVVRYTLFGVEGGPGHGVDRLLLFNRNLRYLGQYRIDYDYHGVWITGSTVHFGAPREWGNVLRLNGSHPPWVAWFLGDTNGFYK